MNNIAIRKKIAIPIPKVRILAYSSFGPLFDSREMYSKLSKPKTACSKTNKQRVTKLLIVNKSVMIKINKME